MIILPAIDLKEGKCVRLEQGLMDRDTVYNENPGAQARIWQEQGGELLHIVDLDGAFAGVPKNREAIKAIIDAIDIPSELGGGIRDMQTIEAYLELGIDRVILGTVAKENPALVEEACKKYPGKIVVGIDAKRWPGGCAWLGRCDREAGDRDGQGDGRLWCRGNYLHRYRS